MSVDRAPSIFSGFRIMKARVLKDASNACGTTGAAGKVLHAGGVPSRDKIEQWLTATA